MYLLQKLILTFSGLLVPTGEVIVVFISARFSVLHSAFHVQPSIHIWRYSPFRVLTSLIRRILSSLFSALLLHPLIPSSCNATLWTTSADPVLGLPTGLFVWKFPFKNFFGILSSSIHIILPSHSNLLNLMSSTIFSSLYKLQSSLFHPGRQRPLTCVGP